MDNLSSSAASAMGKPSAIYLIYNLKIESFELDLLNTKIVSILS